MEKQGDICEVLNTGKGRFLTDRDFVPLFGGFDYVKKVFKFRLKGYLIHHHLNGDSPKGFILTVLSALISILTFRRPVITFHAGPVQLYFPKFKAPKLTPLYWYIFHAAKFIICNNEAVKENIMSYGIRRSKIFPIPAFSRQYLNFNKVELDKNLEEILEKKYPAIFCYVAYRPEFFLEDMLKGFKKYHQLNPNAHLIMIGHDTEAHDFKEQVREMDLDDAVYFAGDLDHDAFLTLMSRSTLYLRTPVKDGVSSSVLESLSLGTPVVASKNGSRPQGVVCYENGNIDDFVEKVQTVADNIGQIKQKIKEPAIEDTVIKEIELIKKA